MYFKLQVAYEGKNKTERCRSQREKPYRCHSLFLLSFVFNTTCIFIRITTVFLSLLQQLFAFFLQWKLLYNKIDEYKVECGEDFSSHLWRKKQCVREFINININIRHMTKSVFGYQESGRLELTHNIFVLKVCFFTSTRGNTYLRYFPLCLLFTYPLVTTDLSILFLYSISWKI